ncbi:hypothetical protein Sru01_33000 [Sphaerisporangium rufum]|uniref:ABC3 transporter permease C-terminal domain-containing protein n=1 Tax=Sphaerisporangium rufum TaxID=1381558 RepID=A0A919R2X6_9ACTN|nr:FtsX-like permease family protein [Sphaerisporangium rufum]GII78318.1 hypothetical protein Sru01_33000 [Sphaerisporangium rufum]
MNPVLLLRVHRGTATVLALLAFSAVLLVAGLPRMFERSYDTSLRGTLDQVGANITDITVAMRPPGGVAGLSGEDQLRAAYTHFVAAAPPALAAVLDRRPGGHGHSAIKTYGTPVAGRIGSPPRAYQYVNVAWLEGADRRVRYVAGAAPGAPSVMRVPGRPDLGELPLFEVAVAAGPSRQMDLKIGTTLLLGNSRPVIARVTALFQPLEPGGPYWNHNLDALNVTVRRPPGGDVDENHITALTSTASIPLLSRQDRELSYEWVVPVRTTAIDARNAAATTGGVIEYRRELTTDAYRVLDYVSALGVSPYEVTTALPEMLQRFLARLATAQALLFLVLGGVLVVAAGVLGLATRLLAERLRPALALARARGASTGRIAGTGAAAVALAVLPPVLAGYGLTFLIPGPVTPVVHIGTLLLALAPIGYAAVLLPLTHRRPLADRREDMVARRVSPRRVVLEVLVVALALAGAYLLRTRGLATDAAARGGDPFLMLVPAALTVAAALITLRCYPYPLRLVAWLTARARPAVPFVGLALAARARSVTALPMLILLPALAVSVFGAVAGGTLDAAQRAAAWQATGAGARVDSAAELAPATVDRVRRVPGVRTVVPADRGTAQVGLSGRTATVVAIDLDAYRRLVAGTPLRVPQAPADPGGRAVPALVSPDLYALGSFEIGWHVRMQLAVKGVVQGGLPGVAFAERSLIVVPYDASRRAGSRDHTTMLLIGGDGVDQARLTEATGGRRDILVTTFEGSLAKVNDTPLTGTIKNSFALATVALAGYALLTVILALVIGATDRTRALSYLRTLGLSERQAAGLTVLEITPLVLLTACAGLALGLVLPAALGRGIDLSAYAGGQAVPAYQLNVTTPVLLAAGLVAVTMAGAFLHAAIGRRRSLGSILRVGE